MNGGRGGDTSTGERRFGRVREGAVEGVGQPPEGRPEQDRLLPPVVPHHQPPQQHSPPCASYQQRSCSQLGRGILDTCSLSCLKSCKIANPCTKPPTICKSHIFMLFQGVEEEVLRSFQNLSDLQDEQRFQNLSFSQLRNATNNFSLENQIEQGPLATLFKGQLHGNDVTIKKHSVISSSEQKLPPSMSQFELCKNEVQILPKLQHKNIVKLLGFCAERSERIVVYEHMENGSLEDVIFVRVGAGFVVDWPTRFRKIQGIAQGVDYLHNHSRLRIIHRDMKPSSILLDSDMIPRISNFDLAKALSPGIHQGTADCVVGSLVHEKWYILCKDRCVQYSFGVMVLEIVSRKRWTQPLQKTYYQDLLTWAINRTTCPGNKMVQRLKGFMHPTMHSVAFCGRAVPRCLSLPTRRRVLSMQREIRRCVRVALLCIQEKTERRPDMPGLTRMLSSRKKAVPFPRRPGYATESPMYAGERSTTTP
ncbi:unnamed protein product [Miscanthus lutarioriparius]|uniref:non-specific serine/threonine protein kinase n=1 Tax=Miscanthus lutarioriparius TaxID=422564 RepID=A0A811QPE1_9POAL|nr:unnamed protein product [Miscanthus lutarioriparius]